ncbi:hypothetical protein DPMN_108544 [Dreissena polymorpha]|uniref:Uncharacterized protein n=1 Tax=Dreissena polymorpha TaxID=45954 RepID=A0A9D4K9B1_DREPO|nr:hypothetical protein DPMN_108544 [Dreissena polymorpha]
MIQERTTQTSAEMTTTNTTDEWLMSTLNQILNSKMIMLRDLEESIRHQFEAQIREKHAQLIEIMKLREMVETMMGILAQRA